MINIHNLIADGYISKRKHPTEDVYILNYTAKTQYKKNWNRITRACRGLIVDSNNKPLYRGFKKFFNLEEYIEQGHTLPNCSFEVTEKLDGSLGILYWIKDKPFIATRGSFESEQAIKATEMLHNINIDYSIFNKKLSYLFEIIYKENKIVIDYGDEEKLVLLAVLNNDASDNIEAFNKCNFPYKREVIKVNSIEDLLKLPSENKEGFVIRYNNGLRIKIKFPNYVKKHYILSNMTDKTIVKALMYELGDKQFKDSYNILLACPDEMYQEVNNTKQKYIDIIQDIESKALKALDKVKDFKRKKQAEILFKKYKDVAIFCFAILDNKKWKIKYLSKLI